MSYQLEIPDKLYTSLKEVADANGLTPIDWIAVHLRQAQMDPKVEIEQKTSPKTLADLFAGRVGRIQSGGKERLSEECDEKLTDYLEEKRSAGRL